MNWFNKIKLCSLSSLKTNLGFIDRFRGVNKIVLQLRKNQKNAPRSQTRSTIIYFYYRVTIIIDVLICVCVYKYFVAYNIYVSVIFPIFQKEEKSIYQTIDTQPLFRLGFYLH